MRGFVSRSWLLRESVLIELRRSSYLVFLLFFMQKKYAVTPAMMRMTQKMEKRIIMV